MGKSTFVMVNQQKNIGNIEKSTCLRVNQEKTMEKVTCLRVNQQKTIRKNNIRLMDTPQHG